MAGEQDYVIIGTGESLPEQLAAEISAAGGSLVSIHPEIGVAYARSASSDFASRVGAVSGVESVTPDIVVQWTDPVRMAAEGLEFDAADVDLSAQVSSIGDNEPLFVFQWAPTAIQAPEAWTAGYTGAGARVAIVDGGIFSGHPDLAPNLDVARSRSFVPGFNFNQDVGTFWHGTHVAGIVAAADNSFGIIGIAPGATLVGVKVLHDGAGPFSRIITGIMYAATPIAAGGAGAHVINLSLGLTVNEKDKRCVDGTTEPGCATFKAAVRELRKAVDRATTYAHEQGVTVVASAGNGATNLDDAKELFTTPAQSLHAIAVAATGPVGWAFRGATNFEQPTFYTDFGKSLVDLAAPGGTSALFTVEGVDEVCVVAGFTNFCEQFDMVLSTTRTGWNWSQGTSMAAPMVSGVAALVIQRHGGTISPAEVRARLQQGAVDLGKPGKDEFYGHGWVNAFRSVQ